MDVKSTQQGAVTIVSVSGNVDPVTSRDLQTDLTQHLAQGRAKIVADFSGVNYMSSAGFRVLLGTLKECRAKGGDFVIAAPQRNITQLIEMSGFTNFLKVYPTVGDAVAKFA
jgi:anti-sigma B factor antagonist